MRYSTGERKVYDDTKYSDVYEERYKVDYEWNAAECKCYRTKYYKRWKFATDFYHAETIRATSTYIPKFTYVFVIYDAYSNIQTARKVITATSLAGALQFLGLAGLENYVIDEIKDAVGDWTDWEFSEPEKSVSECEYDVQGKCKRRKIDLDDRIDGPEYVEYLLNKAACEGVE